MLVISDLVVVLNVVVVVSHIQRIMQEGVFITPQEAMEPVLNKALIDYE